MLSQDDVTPYLAMCAEEGVNLQRGMNYRLRGRVSVILMSLRPGAPYADRVEDNGTILIYEGHDIARKQDGRNPKTVDQPMMNRSGTLTQNGLFYEAAVRHKSGSALFHTSKAGRHCLLRIFRFFVPDTIFRKETESCETVAPGRAQCTTSADCGSAGRGL